MYQRVPAIPNGEIDLQICVSDKYISQTSIYAYQEVTKVNFS